MNTPTPILSLLACLSIISCQQHATSYEALPDPGPLPAWTQSKAAPAKTTRQFKIETKLIEISYEKGTRDSPKSPYQKRMTKTEKELYLRSISMRKGVDLMTSPSVVTRVGQVAKIELNQELPNLDPLSGKPNTSDAIGVTEYFRIHPQSGNKALKLDTVIQVRDLQEFGEFKNNSTPPIIKTRRFDESIDMTSGETILFGGLVSDHIPKGQKTILKTELIALVTVTEIDRNGR